MNIVLIGFRGAGKSTVGKILAERTKRSFVDTDDLVEKRAGASIQEMVKAGGWGYFRALEKKVIEEISRRDDLVIAPGGGAVLDEDNMKALGRKGRILWLKADLQVLLQRMEQDPRNETGRPALTGKGTAEESAAVLAGRTPFYQRAAHAELDTSFLDPEGVAAEVLCILKEKGGA